MPDLNEKYKEFDYHLMNDAKPSEYFNRILNEGIVLKEYPFKMLGELVNTMQSKEHHPEGNVWNHTMLVLDNAAANKGKSKNPRSFMWAALLHDLGKPSTTKLRKGKITSYDHDKVGENLSEEFLKNFTEDEGFINDVGRLVRWHMQILFVNKNLPFGDVNRMKEETDVEEVALLGLCDRLGRGEMTQRKVSEEKENIELFLKKCKQ